VSETYTPERHPFVDEKGHITRPWLLLLQTLTGATSAPTDPLGPPAPVITWRTEPLMTDVSGLAEYVTANGDVIMVRVPE
jgi:hypothetical protein